MSGTRPRTAHPETTRRGLSAAWRRNGLVWLGLLLLQAASVGLATLAPPGRVTLAGLMLIAAVQAAVVGIVSMDLSRSPVLNRLAAASGFVFIAVMFALTFGDLFTRL
ncbi:MAG: cytochrome C oxidase subunit IV family protein [Parafilimonas terrae]|nr:cytochrome C oxidase subunit IV family protein [Parafilimonas terrae]